MPQFSQDFFLTLTGKFHCHYTVESDKNTLITYSKGKPLKTTFIHLTGTQNSAHDAMLTRHWLVDSKNKTTDSLIILEDIKADVLSLKEHNLSPIRVKLEYENSWNYDYTPETYGECHIKIFSTHHSYDNDRQKIKSLITENTLALSRNPNEKNDSGFNYFLNKRFYSGTQKDATEFLETLKISLENLHITVRDIKLETTLFDTNHSHDHWWA